MKTEALWMFSDPTVLFRKRIHKRQLEDQGENPCLEQRSHRSKFHKEQDRERSEEEEKLVKETTAFRVVHSEGTFCQVS